MRGGSAHLDAGRGVVCTGGARTNRRGGRVIGWAIAIAGSTSLAIQASHVFVPGREIDMTSVLMAVLGSAAGAVAVAVSPAGNPRRFVPAALCDMGPRGRRGVVESASVCLAGSAILASRVDRAFLVVFRQSKPGRPGRCGRPGAGIHSAGFTAGLCSWRQTFTGAVLIGLGAGLVLEGGQAFLPRTTDISDAISAAAGAGLGLAMWRWGERARTSPFGAARYRVGQR